MDDLGEEQFEQEPPELGALLYSLAHGSLRSLADDSLRDRAEKALAEFRDMRAELEELRDRAELCERRREVGDVLAWRIEALEANPTDPELWTALADTITEWRGLRR